MRTAPTPKRIEKKMKSKPLRVCRALRRNQWKTTPRTGGHRDRRRVPWELFNKNFKREAARA